MARSGRRRLRWWIAGAVVVVVVLAVGVPFAYIHFIEGPAPARLTLPQTGDRSGGAGSATVGTDSVAGTWHVGPGSVVGYRVDEVLIGQHSTAVGRTTRVSGAVTISGTTVTGAAFTVDMASVKSDQSQRNAQFDGRIMDVARFPTATLRLTAPIALGRVAAVGTSVRYSATGDLTMHGVTKSVTFPVSAERIAGSAAGGSAGGIDILADVPVRFARWDIANPSVGGFVTTAQTGTLEALLHLTRGTGNTPVPGGPAGGAGEPGGPGGGASAPVTVPRTTVPPLTIPTRG